MSAITDLLKSSKDADEISYAFDRLDHAARIAELEQLEAEHFARLFDIASGRGCTLGQDVVPLDRPPHVAVVHTGIHSIPVFRGEAREPWWSRSHRLRRFERVYCRPVAPQPKSCVGYNNGAVRQFAGPGYFVAREEPDSFGVTTVVIDYTLTPHEAVEGWPAVVSGRRATLLYGRTRDWMWRVSKHVTVTRARRNVHGGWAWLDNWSVLCRM